jgi:GT2 family glycosyltransferase
MSNHDVAVVLLNWRGANDTIGRFAAISKLEAPRPLSIVIENGSGDASAATLREASDLDILIELCLQRDTLSCFVLRFMNRISCIGVAASGSLCVWD